MTINDFIDIVTSSYGDYKGQIDWDGYRDLWPDSDYCGRDFGNRLEIAQKAQQTQSDGIMYDTYHIVWGKNIVHSRWVILYK